MEKEYRVYGTITIQVELDINANSEEEAIKQAKEILKDDYNLNVIGYHHIPDEDIELDLTAIEYDEE